MTDTITLSDFLCLGEKIKKPEKIVNKLNKGKQLKNYSLVLFEDDNVFPVIMSSRLFLQKKLRIRQYLIIAIYKEYDDAVEFIRALTELSYKKYNDFVPRRVISECETSELKSLFCGEPE